MASVVSPPARGWIARVDRAVERIGRAASWLTLAIVVLMAANVLLRYAFSIGSVWSQELEWHLLAPLVLVGMTYALQQGEHVRVDIFYARYPERTKAAIDLLAGLLAIVVGMLVIRYSIAYVQQSYVDQRDLVRPRRPHHRWVLKALIPLGFALFALQALAQSVARRSALDPGCCAMTPHEWLAIGLLIGFFALLMAGVPVGITLAASGFVFGFMGFGETLFNLLPARIYGVVANYQWLAIPLFVFMGVMLEKSRLAEDLLDVIGHLAGGLRGGMALGIIGVGVLMGATTGIVGATVITLGLLTLPTLLRRGYDPAITCGAICASGTLGQIIPPSLVLILLSDIMQQSVGTLFAAAVMPGLMLAALYCVYIVVYGMRAARTRCRRCRRPSATRCRAPSCGCVCFKVALPPLALVLSVLGSIIGGVAAPTEAASMGALGSIVVVALARRLTLDVLRDVMRTTTRISAMVLFILICAQVFSLAFRGLQGEKLIEDLFAFLPGGVNAEIWFLMALIFVLGFFLEWIEISYIAVPLFLPIFTAAGVDPVWLAMLITVNLQTSFLTPPFGWALFFLRGVAPPQITTRHIYVGIIPFVALQALGVVLVFYFPAIATWLPKAIGW